MHKGSWDSLDGTVTCYGLHGLGIEYWCVRDFPWLSRSAPRLTQSPVWFWVPPGSKSTRAWCWPYTCSSTKVANELELHLCLSSMPAYKQHKVIFTFRCKYCLLQKKKVSWNCRFWHCPLPSILSQSVRKWISTSGTNTEKKPIQLSPTEAAVVSWCSLQWKFQLPPNL